jgi:hypothetical protein
MDNSASICVTVIMELIKLWPGVELVTQGFNHIGNKTVECSNMVMYGKVARNSETLGFVLFIFLDMPQYTLLDIY